MRSSFARWLIDVFGHRQSPLLACVLAAAACSSSSTPTSSSSTSPTAGQAAQSAAPARASSEPLTVPGLRLPRTFLPTGYDATLAIDPAKIEFTGKIAITGNLSERSSVIWLHGKKLDVKRAVAVRNGVETALAASAHGEDLLAFQAAAPLEAGTWTLHIDYAGAHDELNTAGSFRQIVEGEPYVYTQLEALFARRVFPCFDEPDNKVPWKLALEVPAKLVAVSNTPVESEQAVGTDKKRVQFALTKPLPSYLVAFGVGPFDIVDAGKTSTGTPIRIVTLKGRAPDAAWAAKTSVKLMELVEEFFGSPYPYEKMDMLTIPVTVGFGAMENAGLITYTETLMLMDPKRAAKQSEYQWILVAAHEIAHQWFGNLVTMDWWNDIWLNEGFADWVENKIAARFEPSWREEVSAVGGRNVALEADSLVSARQIRQPIVVAGDIQNAFDSITYNKGAAILNMFEGYLGSDKFLRGVREHLKQHAFGNATSAEFAAAISKAAGVDVSAAFATFLEQPGTPEITANLVCDKGQAPRVALSQRRYVPPGSPTPPASKPWMVPVCVAFDRGGKRAESCNMLEAENGSISLDVQACPRWMMPNVDGRGYYRSAYTAAQVTGLRDDAWKHLRATEQRAAFFDITEQVTLGKLPLTLALSFVPKLMAVGDRFSIGAALLLPVNVYDQVPDELRPKYEAWMQKTFGPAARRSGLSPKDGDTLDVESVRGALVSAVGKAGRDPVLSAEAVKLAAKWRDLPQSIRGQVLDLAAHASPEVFDRLLKEAYTEPDRARRHEIMHALGSSRDVAQQQRALALVLDPKIDIRDVQYMLFFAQTQANKRVSQKFVRDHKDAIMKRIPTDGTTSGQAWLAYAFTATCDAAERDSVVAYVNENFAVLNGGARIAQQAIEGMDQCIAGRKLMEPEVRNWLTALPGNATPAKAAP